MSVIPRFFALSYTEENRAFAVGKEMLYTLLGPLFSNCEEVESEKFTTTKPGDSPVAREVSNTIIRRPEMRPRRVIRARQERGL
jgi:hypothetical protein